MTEPNSPSTARSEAERSPRLQLSSLAPRYDPEQHEIYLEALQDALDQSSTIHNIALTGPYGTGKSSVLQELARRYPERVVQVSLSSVGEEPAEAVEGGVVSAVTNRIQQEIVKQILYRDAPHRTRGSRFRRVSQLRLLAELPVIALTAAMLVVLLWLTRWSVPLVVAAGKDGVWIAAAYLALGGLLTAALLTIRWLTYGRLSLEKLTAGPATVTLTGQPDSYFDRYVDEIVYFFEKTGRDIVILEDLDRFRDVHIFQSLRALNTLLNTADQVRRRRRVGRKRGDRVPEVVFIYALRDSVFERLGEDGTSGGEGDDARQEAQLANRTKFFELVIPVVPFITHRNARDLMHRQMSSTGVGPRLIRLAAQHVADQRLIIDLRNEYDVYADRLLVAGRSMPGLTPDKLFAMLLYKSVHLGDFEQIRFGTSRLDRLHEAWRALVSSNIDRVSLEDTAAATSLTREGAAQRHAVELGTRLDEIVQAKNQNQNQSPRSYTVQVGGDAPQPSAALRTPAFWARAQKLAPTLTFSTGWNSLQVTWAELPTLLDRPMRPELWLEVNADRERRVRREAVKTLTFLTHHGWEQIYSRPEFRLIQSDGTAATFADLTSQLLDSRLARDLVAAGFIDEYFALYVSMYYGEVVGPAALDFMVHALDRGKPDFDYPLTPDDVEAVLLERGEDVLRDPAFFNVPLLDYLLSAGDRADPLVERLREWGRGERQFVARYLQRGTEGITLVKSLAFAVPDLVRFLLKEVQVSDDLRAQLIDAALTHGDESDSLEDVEGFAGWVLAWYPQFPSLTAEDPTPDVTAAVRLGVEGIVLPDVTRLNRLSLAALAKNGAYAVTGPNLQAVTGQDQLALDVLAAAHPAVEQRVLRQLSTYVDVIAAAADGQQVTVLDPDAFVPRLVAADAEVAGATEVMRRMVELAAGDCRVATLTDAPPSTWRALLLTDRTPLTAPNLLAYLDAPDHENEAGALGELAALLADLPALTDVESVTQPDRRRLATALLATPLPPRRRVELAAGLGLEEPLRVDQIHGETGEFAALLLQRGLLADDAETFASSLMLDWPSREAAIISSSVFAGLLDPAVLPATHYGLLFESERVSDQVKRSWLTRMDAYVGLASTTAFEAAAVWALQDGGALTGDELHLLQRGGASGAALVNLLVQAPELELGTVRNLLRRVGGPYAVVADPGTRGPLLPDDRAHRALLERLRGGGVVSGYRETTTGLRVSLRRS